MPNIYQTAMYHALRRPGAIALSDDTRELNFNSLSIRARQLAHWAHLQGVRRGDRVAVLANNSIDYLALIHATAIGGFCVVPVNTRYTAAELCFLMRDCSPKLLLFAPEFEPVVVACREQLPMVCAPLWQRGFPGRSQREENPGNLGPIELRQGCVQDDEVALIVYTSGTTSAPKGAMLSHANLVWNAVNYMIELGIDADTRALLATPLFHIGGFGVLNGPILYAGGRLHVISQFEPAVVLRSLLEVRPTHLFLLSTMWVGLTDHPEFERLHCPEVRYVQTAASPLSVWRQDLIRRAFPQAEFGWGFGMTETCVTTIKNRFTREILDHPGSIGYVWRHISYRLIDDAGEELADQRGPGELQIKGPTVFKGYWGKASPPTSGDGWLSTGDLMRFDDEGFAYFVGRSKDMVKTGGENVAALEVENCLVEHPAVSQAAVIGLPHEYWGEELVAVVVAREGQSPVEEELRRWCRQRLAGFKVPKRLFLVDDLPLSSSGKVQKFLLRESLTRSAELGLAVPPRPDSA